MNDVVKVAKFNPADLYSLLKTPDSIYDARFKQIAGPALSIFLDDELVACAGIQTVGVGEAWAVFSEKAKSKKILLVKETRKWLDFLIRENKFWRLWSECPDEINKQRFIELLHFEKKQAFVRG